MAMAVLGTTLLPPAAVANYPRSVGSISQGSNREFARSRKICCNARSRSSFSIIASSSSSPQPTSSSSTSTASSPQSVKDFLEDLKSVGRIRIIVNTGVGVLESVTRLDSLFYSDVPGKGEYANVMSKQDNVDFHLLVDKIASAKLVQGRSMRGDMPTYMVRLFDRAQANVASFLVMWRPDENVYDDGQVEAFNRLLEKYGSEIEFS